MSCKHLLKDNQCNYRIPQKNGNRNIQASMEIRAAFMAVAEKSDQYKNAPLGVACGGYICCFSAGRFAIWDDCPYFEIN